MKFHASDADEIAAALSDAMSRSIGYRPHVLTRVGPFNPAAGCPSCCWFW
jgi:hypothetical protein